MVRNKVKTSSEKRKKRFPFFWIIVGILVLVGVALIAVGSPVLVGTESGEKGETSAKPESSYVDFVVRIDGAIHQAIIDLGINEKEITVRKNKDIEQLPGTKFASITIKINNSFPMGLINYVFQRTIIDSAGRIINAVESKTGTELSMQVAYGDIKTHNIKIIRKAGIPIKPAYVALLIDDFGYYPVPTARGFLELGITFTASILPYAEYTQYFIRELEKNKDKTKNIERMVHIPMEPKSYPKDDPGPNAILVSQDDREILGLAQKAIEAVPGAVGANNHMGSKATENSRVMYQVLRAVRDAGLFWIDSRTTPYTISVDVAKDMKIPAMHIDHVIDPPGIDVDQTEQRLYTYCMEARRTSAMVLNCHSSDTTLMILQRNIPSLMKYGVEFITVSQAKERKLAESKR